MYMHVMCRNILQLLYLASYRIIGNPEKKGMRRFAGAS